MAGGARSASSELEKKLQRCRTGEKLTFWTPLIEGTTELLGMKHPAWQRIFQQYDQCTLIIPKLTSEFPEILKWQPHTFVSGYVFSLCYATIQPPRLQLQWKALSSWLPPHSKNTTHIYIYIYTYMYIHKYINLKQRTHTYIYIYIWCINNMWSMIRPCRTHISKQLAGEFQSGPGVLVQSIWVGQPLWGSQESAIGA